jgi:hypothetical protein
VDEDSEGRHAEERKERRAEDDDEEDDDREVRFHSMSFGQGQRILVNGRGVGGLRGRRAVGS